MISVENALSRTVAEAFEEGWLSRYPAFTRCIHDNENGFLGPALILMSQKNKIKSVPTTVKIPKQILLWKECTN